MSNSPEKNKSLFDFIKSPANSQNSSNLPALRTSMTAALKGVAQTSSLLLGKDDKEADKFRTEVTKIATSDELLKDVSREIGTPKANETEDDFVKRGSAVFRARLEKALNKK